MKPVRVQPAERGIALIAVLVAVTMLLLLALPFAISMSRGADAAQHAIEEVTAEQLSASVRDDLLSQSALGHGTFDPTPTYDERSEWPDAPSAGIANLPLDGRARFGGEVHDLQRYLPLNGGSPLLFANVLGLTARLAADFTSDATTIQLDDATRLPDSGIVWIDHELIQYGQKQGNVLKDLTRSLLTDQWFYRAEDHGTVAETALVLDWRCVLAATWSFDGRTGGTRKERKPLRDARELTEIAAVGMGAFSPREIDLLAAAFHGETEILSAPTFGRPERLFEALTPPARTLVVKGALSLGAGSIVRIRNLRTGAAEFGLVMSTYSRPVQREIQLPSEFRLDLLNSVTQEFPAIDSVVEPLLTAPVNINTASPQVIAAIFAHVRRSMNVRVVSDPGASRMRPQAPVSFGEARELAEQIVGMRAGDGAQEGAFAGWREVAERIFKPKFDASSDQNTKVRWTQIYSNLLTGRDAGIEMGTAPLCFQSGPLVHYRAAASLQRSAVAPGIAARHERSGTAIALPGLLLRQPWDTQEQLEEAFRLDQRAPWYLTSPINIGGAGAGSAGNEPASRVTAHVIGMAFPDLGLGSPRFPSRERTDVSFGLSPASTPLRGYPNVVFGNEAFATAQDPRGRDVSRDGPFLCTNTGPREDTPAPKPAATHELQFPFSTTGGYASRFAASFWTEPDALGSGTLFDYSDGNRERNRMALFVRDGNLVYEVLDEAGLDPEPNRSPAGLPRTSVEWQLPLAELGLPGRTPMHVAATAYSNRPSDISVAIDGIVRGKVKYRTRLTAAVSVYDPAIRPSGSRPGSFATNDPMFVDLQVESVEGFPQVGVVRVGTELFEYSEIRGNTLVCRYKDSLGGRSRRQSAREMRIDLKPGGALDPNVDFNKAGEANRELEVFPEHPAGSEVELYGYSAMLSPDTLVHVGETRTDGSLGAFAIARVYVQNARPITLSAPPAPPIQLGVGLDINYTGDINLVEPPKAGVELTALPPAPPDAPKEILDAFSTGGGYALLVQRRLGFDPGLGQIGATVEVGGMELIRYSARQGAKLTGIQRNVTLAGQNTQIQPGFFDGTARQFVTDWDLTTQPQGAPRPSSYDQFPQLCTFVVPISFAVQNADSLADPAVTLTSEWLQFYPAGAPEETEWVRYDLIADRRHIVRSNRAAWAQMYFALTTQAATERVQLGRGGATNNTFPWPQTVAEAWGTVEATAGYIGYVPQLEASYPEIARVRQALGFRGDPFTQTSSHPQPNSTILPVHRLQLHWGNYGGMTARPGRLDRAALISGSTATGTSRPAVEWHTVHWSVRRFTPDYINREQPPAELLGRDPFQLVSFQEAVQRPFLGPASNANGQAQTERSIDTRNMDRLVKFPSGELPAAFCEKAVFGGAVGGGDVTRGAVDEIEVTNHAAADVVVDESFREDAQSFKVQRGGEMRAQGLWFGGADYSAAFPPTGGLVQIGDEVLAYAAQQDGTFQIAKNGRGLLGTEPRTHDRGARVHFLTHRACAILSSGVAARDDKFPVQSLGALPPRMGTVLLGRRELIHYTWVRVSGEQASLEMPRYWPPGEDGNSPASHGLFRGRYGTAPLAASAGEPLIAFPFRHWDRYVERSDDPEQAYFQLTTREAPVFFRSLAWTEETQDATVDVVCLVRADARSSFRDEPNKAPMLWQFTRGGGDDKPSVLGVQATQLEVRFATVYKSGCLDLAAFRAHGWKTAPSIKDVRLDYEGEGRVLAERTVRR